MRDTLQAVVEGLCRELARPVLVDDASLRLLAHSPLIGTEDQVRVEAILNRRTPPEVASLHFEQGIATAEAPMRTRARPALGLEERLCVPIRKHGRVLGFLWVIDPDRTLTPDEIAVAASGAEAVAELLYRRDSVAVADERDGAALIRRLITSDQKARHDATSEARERGRLVEVGSLCAVVFRIDTGPDATAVTRPQLDYAGEPLSRAMLEQGMMAALDHGEMVALLCNSTPSRGIPGMWPDVERLHARLVAELPEAAGEGLHTGCGEPVPRIDDLYRSYRQGAHAALVDARLGSSPGSRRWADLGVYRLFLDLPIDAMSADELPQPLRRLLLNGAGPKLLDTLERYLDLAGDAQRTASELVLHRTTLYYRLHRIEEIAGCDFRDGATRLELHIGLKMARLAGILPSAGHDPPTAQDSTNV